MKTLKFAILFFFLFAAVCQLVKGLVVFGLVTMICALIYTIWIFNDTNGDDTENFNLT